MTFHVGQKVVCVDPVNELVKDRIYIVSAVGRFIDKIMIDVEGIQHYAPYAWFIERFRPIQERKTDIGFAHEILRKVTRKDQVRA